MGACAFRFRAGANQATEGSFLRAFDLATPLMEGSVWNDEGQHRLRFQKPPRLIGLNHEGQHRLRFRKSPRLISPPEMPENDMECGPWWGFSSWELAPFVSGLRFQKPPRLIGLNHEGQHRLRFQKSPRLISPPLLPPRCRKMIWNADPGGGSHQTFCASRFRAEANQATEGSFLREFDFATPLIPEIVQTHVFESRGATPAAIPEIAQTHFCPRDAGK